MEMEFKINGIPLANKGYFINLDRSIDRKNMVTEQISKFKIEGLSRFCALTDDFVQSSCTKSHLAVFRLATERDLDAVFVAEDDFDFQKTCYYPPSENEVLGMDVLEKVSNQLKNVEWDVVLFGCNPKSPLISVTDNLCKVFHSTGAWAYLIKKRAYKYLLEHSNYNADYTAIDDYLPMLNYRGFNTLTTIPMLIGHAVGIESTLQPRGPVDYTVWINGNYDKFFYENPRDHRIEQNLTIVIAGHFVENYLYYLKYLFHSIPNELMRCRFIVHYDEPDINNFSENRRSLVEYFREVKSGINLEISFGFGGLISTIKNSLDKIRTPYFLFLEHDWVFINKSAIDFDSVLEAFDSHDYVNAVWFSKDDNIMRGFDIAEDVNKKATPFSVEERIDEAPLITTVRWSNNPAIFRTPKMKEWFAKYIDNPYVGISHQGCYNVEETMIREYRNTITSNKWEDIRDQWGTYLYGKIGEGPFVAHLDASKRYQGASKSQPEINGETYIKNNPL